MVLAILQARSSSKRLPGKVLKPILGKPMLQLQIERIKRSKYIDRIVVATSDSADDVLIHDLCSHLGISCYQGSLDDVLDRFYQCAKMQPGNQHIMRLTGDCPLIDPGFLDILINFYQSGAYDYASNSLQPSLPDGLDAEIFSFSALEQAWKNARLKSEREHVTPYIYRQGGEFNVGIFRVPIDLSWMRWTVDEPEDFFFVERVYQSLYPLNPEFTTTDVLKLLYRNYEMVSSDARFVRNQGYVSSLEKDIADESKI